MELFKKIRNSNDLEISISYLEIYNEHVYDLLAPTTGLYFFEKSFFESAFKIDANLFILFSNDQQVNH